MNWIQTCSAVIQALIQAFSHSVSFLCSLIRPKDLGQNGSSNSPLFAVPFSSPASTDFLPGHAVPRSTLSKRPCQSTVLRCEPSFTPKWLRRQQGQRGSKGFRNLRMSWVLDGTCLFVCLFVCLLFVCLFFFFFLSCLKLVCLLCLEVTTQQKPPLLSPEADFEASGEVMRSSGRRNGGFQDVDVQWFLDVINDLIVLRGVQIALTRIWFSSWFIYLCKTKPHVGKDVNASWRRYFWKGFKPPTRLIMTSHWIYLDITKSIYIYTYKIRCCYTTMTHY